MKNHKITAILLMGGIGTRFGDPLPKQLHRLAGKPVFLYALQQFSSLDLWNKIILAIPYSRKEEILSYIQDLPYANLIQLVAAGNSRQESSYNALLSCDPDTDYVVIHDAVRPFVKPEILLCNVAAVLQHGAVDTCIPSADTIVYAENPSQISSIPDRRCFLRGQTPQSFAYPLLLKAHRQAILDNITNSSDDCQLVSRLSHPIHIVPGHEQNIKITTELDLFLAEQILCHALDTIPSQQDTPLKGKVFVVTGGTGDIGKSICQTLLEYEAIPIPLSTSTTPFSADLTNISQTQQVFQDIFNTYGPLDGLINSVGSFALQDFLSLSDKDILHSIETNLLSVIYCCQSACIKPGGHIVNISSSSYSRGRKEYPIYSASKAALVNFTQSLAAIQPDLHVNILAPQRTLSSKRQQYFPNEDVHSLLHPRDIAEKIALLLSSSVTGLIIPVRKT